MYFKKKSETFQTNMNVALAIVQAKNSILLLKRTASSSRMPEKWAIPGGKIEKYETFSSAIIRELEEETGIKFENKSIQKLVKYWVINENRTLTVSICNINLHKKVIPVLNKSEHDDYMWVDISQLSNYSLMEYLHEWIMEIKALPRQTLGSS